MVDSIHVCSMYHFCTHVKYDDCICISYSREYIVEYYFFYCIL